MVRNAAIMAMSWFVDETYVKVNGLWRYVYRAVDQYGQVIDVFVSARQDADAARRFFRRALATLKVTPSEVVTDAAAVYPGVLDELIPSAWHHVEQYANPGIGPRSRPRNGSAVSARRPLAFLIWNTASLDVPASK